MIPLVLPGVASLSFGGPRPGTGPAAGGAGEGPVCGIDSPRRGARPAVCRDMRVGWLTAGRMRGAGEDSCGGAGDVMIIDFVESVSFRGGGE